eukprot:gene8792-6179_t
MYFRQLHPQRGLRSRTLGGGLGLRALRLTPPRQSTHRRAARTFLHQQALHATPSGSTSGSASPSTLGRGGALGGFPLDRRRGSEGQWGSECLLDAYARLELATASGRDSPTLSSPRTSLLLGGAGAGDALPAAARCLWPALAVRFWEFGAAAASSGAFMKDFQVLCSRIPASVLLREGNPLHRHDAGPPAWAAEVRPTSARAEDELLCPSLPRREAVRQARGLETSGAGNPVRPTDVPPEPPKEKKRMAYEAAPVPVPEQHQRWSARLRQLATLAPQHWVSHIKDGLFGLPAIKAEALLKPATLLRRWHDVLFALTRNSFLNPSRAGAVERSTTITAIATAVSSGGHAHTTPLQQVEEETDRNAVLQECDEAMRAVLHLFYDALEGRSQENPTLGATHSLTNLFPPALTKLATPPPPPSPAPPALLVWSTRLPVLVWRRLFQCYREHGGTGLARAARLFELCVLREEALAAALQRAVRHVLVEEQEQPSVSPATAVSWRGMLRRDVQQLAALQNGSRGIDIFCATALLLEPDVWEYYLSAAGKKGYVPLQRRNTLDVAATIPSSSWSPGGLQAAAAAWEDAVRHTHFAFSRLVQLYGHPSLYQVLLAQRTVSTSRQRQQQRTAPNQNQNQQEAQPERTAPDYHLERAMRMVFNIAVNLHHDGLEGRRALDTVQALLRVLVEQTIAVVAPSSSPPSPRRMDAPETLQLSGLGFFQWCRADAAARHPSLPGVVADPVPVLPPPPPQVHRYAVGRYYIAPQPTIAVIPVRPAGGAEFSLRSVLQTIFGGGDGRESGEAVWWRLQLQCCFAAATDKLERFALRCADAWTDCLSAVTYAEALRMEWAAAGEVEMCRTAAPHGNPMWRCWLSTFFFTTQLLRYPPGLVRRTLPLHAQRDEATLYLPTSTCCGDHSACGDALLHRSRRVALEAIRYALLSVLRRASGTVADLRAGLYQRTHKMFTITTLEAMHSAEVLVQAWAQRVGQPLGLQQELHLEPLWELVASNDKTDAEGCNGPKTGLPRTRCRTSAQEDTAYWLCGCGYQHNRLETLTCTFCACSSLEAFAWVCPSCLHPHPYHSATDQHEADSSTVPHSLQELLPRDAADLLLAPYCLHCGAVHPVLQRALQGPSGARGRGRAVVLQHSNGRVKVEVVSRTARPAASASPLSSSVLHTAFPMETDAAPYLQRLAAGTRGAHSASPVRDDMEEEEEEPSAETAAVGEDRPSPADRKAALGRDITRQALHTFFHIRAEDTGGEAEAEAEEEEEEDGLEAQRGGASTPYQPHAHHIWIRPSTPCAQGEEEDTGALGCAAFLVCYDCGTRTASASKGTTITAVPKRLWVRYCGGCHGASLIEDAAPMPTGVGAPPHAGQDTGLALQLPPCGYCGYVEDDAADNGLNGNQFDSGGGFIVPYFTWRCGCGARNAPLHRHCYACTAAHIIDISARAREQETAAAAEAAGDQQCQGEDRRALRGGVLQAALRHVLRSGDAAPHRRGGREEDEYRGATARVEQEEDIKWANNRAGAACYTCPQCQHRVGCGAGDVAAAAAAVAACPACRAPHPRFEAALERCRLRICTQCYQYVDPSDPSGGIERVCQHCGSPQPQHPTEREAVVVDSQPDRPWCCVGCGAWVPVRETAPPFSVRRRLLTQRQCPAAEMCPRCRTPRRLPAAGFLPYRSAEEEEEAAGPVLHDDSAPGDVLCGRLGEGWTCRHCGAEQPDEPQQGEGGGGAGSQCHACCSHCHALGPLLHVSEREDAHGMALPTSGGTLSLWACSSCSALLHAAAAESTAGPQMCAPPSAWVAFNPSWSSRCLTPGCGAEAPPALSTGTATANPLPLRVPYSSPPWAAAAAAAAASATGRPFVRRAPHRRSDAPIVAADGVVPDRNEEQHAETQQQQQLEAEEMERRRAAREAREAQFLERTNRMPFFFFFFVVVVVRAASWLERRRAVVYTVKGRKQQQQRSTAYAGGWLERRRSAAVKLSIALPEQLNRNESLVPPRAKALTPFVTDIYFSLRALLVGFESGVEKEERDWASPRPSKQKKKKKTKQSKKKGERHNDSNGFTFFQEGKRKQQQPQTVTTTTTNKHFSPYGLQVPSFIRDEKGGTSKEFTSGLGIYIYIYIEREREGAGCRTSPLSTNVLSFTTAAMAPFSFENPVGPPPSGSSPTNTSSQHHTSTNLVTVVDTTALRSSGRGGLQSPFECSVCSPGETSGGAPPASHLHINFLASTTEGSTLGSPIPTMENSTSQRAAQPLLQAPNGSGGGGTLSAQQRHGGNSSDVYANSAPSSSCRITPPPPATSLLPAGGNTNPAPGGGLLHRPHNADGNKISCTPPSWLFTSLSQMTTHAPLSTNNRPCFINVPENDLESSLLQQNQLATASSLQLRYREHQRLQAGHPRAAAPPPLLLERGGACRSPSGYATSASSSTGSPMEDRLLHAYARPARTSTPSSTSTLPSQIMFNNILVGRPERPSDSQSSEQLSSFPSQGTHIGISSSSAYPKETTASPPLLPSAAPQQHSAESGPSACASTAGTPLREATAPSANGIWVHQPNELELPSFSHRHASHHNRYGKPKRHDWKHRTADQLSDHLHPRHPEHTVYDDIRRPAVRRGSARHRYDAPASPAAADLADRQPAGEQRARTFVLIRRGGGGGEKMSRRASGTQAAEPAAENPPSCEFASRSVEMSFSGRLAELEGSGGSDTANPQHHASRATAPPAASSELQSVSGSGSPLLRDRCGTGEMRANSPTTSPLRVVMHLPRSRSAYSSCKESQVVVDAPSTTTTTTATNDDSKPFSRCSSEAGGEAPWRDTSAPPRSAHSATSRDENNDPIHLTALSSGMPFAAIPSSSSVEGSYASSTGGPSRLSRCKRQQASISRPAFDLARVQEVSREDLEETMRQTEARNAARCFPMSEINPYIYVGSWRDAHNTQLLRSKGIEYVLNVAEEVEDGLMSSQYCNQQPSNASSAMATVTNPAHHQRGRLDSRALMEDDDADFIPRQAGDLRTTPRLANEKDSIRSVEDLCCQADDDDTPSPSYPSSQSQRPPRAARSSVLHRAIACPTDVSTRGGVEACERRQEQEEHKIEWKSLRMSDCHSEDIYDRLDEAFEFICKAERSYTTAMSQVASGVGDAGQTNRIFSLDQSPPRKPLANQGSEPQTPAPPLRPGPSCDAASPDNETPLLLNNLTGSLDHQPPQRPPYGRILIHCRRGISRSAAIVVGYLMATEGLSYDDALAHVVSRRSCVSLNLAFQEKLRDYVPDPKWRRPEVLTAHATAAAMSLSQKRQRPPSTASGESSSSAGAPPSRPPHPAMSIRIANGVLAAAAGNANRMQRQTSGLHSPSGAPMLSAGSPFSFTCATPSTTASSHHTPVSSPAQQHLSITFDTAIPNAGDGPEEEPRLPPPCSPMLCFAGGLHPPGSLAYTPEESPAQSPSAAAGTKMGCAPHLEPANAGGVEPRGSRPRSHHRFKPHGLFDASCSSSQQPHGNEFPLDDKDLFGNRSREPSRTVVGTMEGSALGLDEDLGACPSSPGITPNAKANKQQQQQQQQKKKKEVPSSSSRPPPPPPLHPSTRLHEKERRILPGNAPLSHLFNFLCIFWVRREHDRALLQHIYSIGIPGAGKGRQQQQQQQQNCLEEDTHNLNGMEKKSYPSFFFPEFFVVSTSIYLFIIIVIFHYFLDDFVPKHHFLILIFQCVCVLFAPLLDTRCCYPPGKGATRIFLLPTPFPLKGFEWLLSDRAEKIGSICAAETEVCEYEMTTTKPMIAIFSFLISFLLCFGEEGGGTERKDDAAGVPPAFTVQCRSKRKLDDMLGKYTIHCHWALNASNRRNASILLLPNQTGKAEDGPQRIGVGAQTTRLQAHNKKKSKSFRMYYTRLSSSLLRDSPQRVDSRDQSNTNNSIKFLSFIFFLLTFSLSFSLSFRIPSDASRACATSAVCLYPPQAVPQPPAITTTTMEEEEGAVWSAAVHRIAVSPALEAAAPPAAGPLKISLQDCLACSGCVTTAEAVLVEAQKAAGRVEGAETWLPRYLFLLTISEASAVSLAAHWGSSVGTAYQRLAGFLSDRIEAEIHQHEQEVLSRAAAASHGGHKDGRTATEEREEELTWPHPPSVPKGAHDGSAPPYLSARGYEVRVSDLGWATSYASEKIFEEYTARLRQPSPPGPPVLPLIVSACPGWCCYCEKLGGDMLSLLSKVMSPQGIAGSYAKRAWRAGLLETEKALARRLLPLLSPDAGEAPSPALATSGKLERGDTGEGASFTLPADTAAAAALHEFLVLGNTHTHPCANGEKNAGPGGPSSVPPQLRSLHAAVFGWDGHAPPVYHISVQPCFDKKLEAARDVLRDALEEDGSQETDRTPPPRPGEARRPGLPLVCTDCVLSTIEVLRWMEEVYSPADQLEHETEEKPLTADAAWAANIPLRPLDSTYTTPTTEKEAAVPVTEQKEDGSMDLETVRLLGSGGYHQQLLYSIWKEHQRRKQQEGPTTASQDIHRRPSPTAVTEAVITPAASHDKRAELLAWLRSPHFSASVHYTPQRNRNHQAVSLSLPSCPDTAGGTPSTPSSAMVPTSLHVAYGFQHIQNVVRHLRKHQSAAGSGGAGGKAAGKTGGAGGGASLKERLAKLRRKTAPAAAGAEDGSSWSRCTFLEVMACPDGCWNGGGQVRSEAPAILHTDPAAAAASFPSPAQTGTASNLFPAGLQRVLEKGAEALQCPNDGKTDPAHTLSQRMDSDGDAALPPPPPRRTKYLPAPPLCLGLTGLRAAASNASWGGELLSYCTFKDRKAEFEAMTATGGVHSLQW